MIEKRIVNVVIDELLAKDYSISVNDGEETTLRNSQDKEQILSFMFTTDEDRLLTYSPDDERGWVLFLYGNGIDVMSDYTVNLNDVVGHIDGVDYE